MAILVDLIPGEQENVWGQIVEDNIKAVNAHVEQVAAQVANIRPNVSGSPNNPITNAAAARPTGLNVVWWRTATDPTNWADGDINLFAGT